MEEFSCNTRLVCGSGAICALGQLGCQRLFLVTESALVHDGSAQRALSAAQCPHTEVFAPGGPEPSVERAAEGAARIRAFRPDLVAALGSGATLDCAKAMVWLSRQKCCLAAIPTSSGSGSEVSDTAVLTRGRERCPMSDPRLRPDLAILDSDLLAQLPRQQIAEDGFEILAHSLEAYVSRRAGAMTDLLAREAFSSAYAALPASYAGNPGVRLKIHQAAAMAGMAFAQAGLGLCHGLAHSLGSFFPVSPGRLKAILLPSVIGCNALAAGGKYAQLARAAGMGGSDQAIALGSLKQGLIRLRRELNLPETLAQAGVDPRAVWCQTGPITQRALADPCCRDNPLPVEDFVVRRILEEITGRFRAERGPADSLRAWPFAARGTRTAQSGTV